MFLQKLQGDMDLRIDWNLLNAVKNMNSVFILKMHES